MQVDDITIGRLGRTSESVTSVTTAWLELAPPAPDRVALIISPPSAGTLYLSTNTSASATDGIRLATGVNPLKLSIQTDGAMVARGWYGQMSVGTSNVTILESYADSSDQLKQYAGIRPVKLV